MRLALNYQRVDPSRGGAETYVVDLCQRLVRAGHEVELYAESWREGALPAAVRCVRVPVEGRTRLGRMFAFGRNSERMLAGAGHDCSVGFINTWGTDVLVPQGGVHGASLEANARRYPGGWRRGLYVAGKKANPRYWAYRAVERRQYDPARPTRYVAVSRMVRDDLVRFHAVAPERVTVVPNAIDFDRLKVARPEESRRALREALGVGPEAVLGLFVGHNFWLKGLAPLLLALAERKSRGAGSRPLRLLVCGGGSLGPFRRMVAELGLGEEVHLMGFAPEVRDCYWASDFFVSPTYYDPCSLVVFEALACGLPVITTACNGAGELLTEGREGFVIPAPEARPELIAALDRMADDRERLAMSVHAARLGREQSMDRHVGRLLEVFEAVAASKRPAGALRLLSPKLGAGLRRPV